MNANANFMNAPVMNGHAAQGRPQHAPSLHWGERTDLLHKHVGYVFSLDLNYTFDLTGEIGPGSRIPIEAQAPDGEMSTFHVLDENLVNTVDGVVRDVPRARVVRGTDWMTVGDTGVISLDGRLLLESDAGAAILTQYNGVLRIPGLMARFRDAIARAAAGRAPAPAMEGSAYVATRYESSQTKFRWLVQNQLVGFGHATMQKLGDDDTPRTSRWTLALSFDLYSVG
jgi:hypothetical protein